MLTLLVARLGHAEEPQPMSRVSITVPFSLHLFDGQGGLLRGDSDGTFALGLGLLGVAPWGLQWELGAATPVLIPWQTGFSLQGHLGYVSGQDTAFFLSGGLRLMSLNKGCYYDDPCDTSTGLYATARTGLRASGERVHFDAGVELGPALFARYRVEGFPDRNSDGPMYGAFAQLGFWIR